MKNESIFDEEYVDCNNCEPYWLNQCDGNNKEKNCTAYKAVKRIDIPNQIKLINSEITLIKQSIKLALATIGLLFVVLVWLSL